MESPGKLEILQTQILDPRTVKIIWAIKKYIIVPQYHSSLNPKARPSG